MRDRLLNRWLQFRGAFWFVPAIMTVLAIVLSFATVLADDTTNWRPSSDSPFGYAGRPDGARSLLAVIAGSTITAAATAFSVTIAALALASSQFGPRLLRNFIADTANQIVLGTFIGTFAYCLLVLRTINGTEGEEFVPQISITVAVALALACIAVLIYFIHHVATSIQANSVIRSVSRDLESSIHRLYRLPVESPEEEETPKSPDLSDDDAADVPANRSGYIQTINVNSLVALARRDDLVIKLNYHAGRFILAKSTLAVVWPKEAANPDVAAGINAALTVGEVRTPTQDVEFALDQLVEIAVRALSPGVNDPFTALSCIDRLGSSLVRIVEREFPEPHRYDDDGALRVIAPVVGFGGVVDAAFNLIRQHGAASPAILIRLLETIAIVARRTESEDQRDALLRQARMVERASRALPEEDDRRETQVRFSEVLRALHRVREEEQEQAEIAEPDAASAG